MNKHFKKTIYFAIICCLAACDHTPGVEKKEPAAKQTLHVMPLGVKHLSKEISLPGVLKPFEFVKIFPRVSGFVKNVYVDRGSIVKKGQVLIRLEAPEVEEHLSAAKLKYSEANAMYLASKDKYERLLETSRTPGTVSPYDLNSAKARMAGDSATVRGEWANYKAQEDMYNYLVVTAPFDGVITERNIHPGALVGPGSQESNIPMLVLQQQSKLRLVVSVPEEYSTQVHDGSMVHFHLNALPGKEFTATISRRSGNLSDKYRSEGVEIDLDNPGGQFIAGMYAEVVLPASGSVNSFVVPNSSVVTTTEKKYVIALRKEQAHWIDVTLGNQTDDSTEIFGSLNIGDEIITNASYDIRDGQFIDNVQVQKGKKLAEQELTTKKKA